MNFSAIYNFGGLRVLVTDSTNVYIELTPSPGNRGHAGYSVPSDRFSELRVFADMVLNPMNYKGKGLPHFEVEGFALRLCYEEGTHYPASNFDLEVAIGADAIKFHSTAAREILRAIETCCHIWAIGKVLSSSMPTRNAIKKGGEKCTR